MLRRVPADLLLLTATLVWSLHWPVAKYAFQEGIGPIAYMAIRSVVGALVLATVTLGTEGTLRIERLDRRAVVVAGLVGIVAYQVTVALSIDHTTASTSALVYGTVPIFVVLFARLAGTERLSGRVLGAAALSFAGVALVALGAEGDVSGDPVGILLALVAAATWGFYTVVVAPLMRRYSAWRVSTALLLVGAVPLTAAAAVELAQEDWGALGALAWLALAYGTLLAFVLNTILWFTAIHRVGPSRSAIYANLQPFGGAVFAVALLSEHLGWVQIVGGVIIGVGILVARRTGRPRGQTGSRPS
ncbi:MAG: DMT family transporter [Thermoleophilia bacterium]